MAEIKDTMDSLPNAGINNGIWTIPKEHLIKKQSIGYGAFGMVDKADYMGTDVVIKTVTNADPMGKILSDREIALLKSLAHPHIVALIGVVENDPEEGVQIVLEYLSKGDIGHYLLDNLQPISWIRKVKIALDVALGMAYLHSRNIIYRDLKPENLLLDEIGNTKICDFGFTRHSYSKWKGMGLEDYLAPEILYGSSKFTTKSDVFSYGMILFEIITRKDIARVIPRDYKNSYKINEESLKKNILLTVSCPAELLDLGCLCIKEDPEKRPNFNQIIGVIKKLLSQLVTIKQCGEVFL